MIRISGNKIKLENLLIDLSAFEVRARVSEQDLEEYYDSFLSHAEEVRDYFEDAGAFDKAVNDAGKEKRPKLIPREPRYPFMWTFTKTSSIPYFLLNPAKRRLHEKYFVNACCIANIPRGSGNGVGERGEVLDIKLREDIRQKFSQYPGYEGIIEIPNDRNQPETKATTFHEALHYLIARYQAMTGRGFVSTMIKANLSGAERYRVEHQINERVVETLTDRLLTHDPDAQFETRWVHYANNGFCFLAKVLSSAATWLLAGPSINRPYLLPTALVPGRIRDYAIHQYKRLKRDKILQPTEHAMFKI